MTVFIARRLLQLIPVLWGVATLVFLLIHFIPGDPVDILLGESALPASKEALREQLNLNKPVLQQYFDFWGGLLRLDLGNDLLYQKPVVSLIAERLQATIELTLLSLLVAIAVSIPLGIISAVYKNSFIDYFSTMFSLLGVSMPNFWFGPLLVLLFAVKLGWLPISERTDWSSYILPALTLGLSLSAILTRLVRASLIDVLTQDYVRTAHAKGLLPRVVFFKHALKNAMIPVITILGLQLGALLSGSIITETIFDWPGLGELMYYAIQQRNYPLVQGCVLLVAVGYVFANLIADIMYTVANPRLRLE